MACLKMDYATGGGDSTKIVPVYCDGEWYSTENIQKYNITENADSLTFGGALGSGIWCNDDLSSKYSRVEIIFESTDTPHFVQYGRCDGSVLPTLISTADPHKVWYISTGTSSSKNEKTCVSIDIQSGLGWFVGVDTNLTDVKAIYFVKK